MLGQYFKTECNFITWHRSHTILSNYHIQHLMWSHYQDYICFKTLEGIVYSLLPYVSVEINF